MFGSTGIAYELQENYIKKNIEEGFRGYKTIRYKDKVYTIGGLLYGDFQDIVFGQIKDSNSVFYVNNIPVPTGFFTSVIFNGFIYVLGGIDDSWITSKVHRAKLNLDGSIERWKTVGDLPFPMAHMCSFIYKNKVYIVGGANISGESSMVFSTRDLTDNYSWKQVGNIPIYLIDAGCVVVNDTLYILGGKSKDKYNKSVFKCNIVSGKLENWTEDTSLPFNVINPEVLFEDNIIKVLTANKHLEGHFNKDGTLDWVTKKVV